MEHSIEVRKTEILKTENALNVVKCEENAVHAAHADLKRVLQQCCTCHVIEFPLKRLPFALSEAQLVTGARLVFFVVHANRDDRSCLEVKDSSAWKTWILSVKLRSHQDITLPGIVVASA